MSTSPIYIPTTAISLATVEKKFQVRLGLQGPPKTGKTFSALSFPNPMVLSFDRGLVAHIGRKDVHEIPFYDDAFVDSLVKRKAPDYIDFETKRQMPRPFNRRDALLKWLYEDGQKLTSEQTLVVDGNTGIQAAFHKQYWTEPAIDKDGKLKKYDEYNRKINYFTELAICLKSVKCNVVYLCHEMNDRNAEGDLNGKIRPLMSGAFKDEMQSHFTDWFRCITVAKPEKQDEAFFLKKYGIDGTVLVEWCASTPPDHKVIYLWQTQSDNIVECGSSLMNVPKYIIANYSSFTKYQRISS